MSSRIRIPGPVAQDKDWARLIRESSLMSELSSAQSICLDFSGVQIATQSFVHALLSEAIRVHGEDGLNKIEFKACSDQVKQAIQTVATYSLRARDLAAEFSAKTRFIRSADVPQADDLGKVRRVVEVLIYGPSPVDLVASLTGYSVRHAYYRASAARVLGLLQLAAGIAVITERGIALVNTKPLVQEEQQGFKDAIESSSITRQLVPGLLARRAPKPEDVTKRLMQIAALSNPTAARRAQCLLSWRRQVLEKQLVLPVGTAHVPAFKKAR